MRKTERPALAMAPMGINALLNPDGNLSPRAIDYYLERVRGGTGLIITHACKVENRIDSTSVFEGIWSFISKRVLEFLHNGKATPSSAPSSGARAVP